MKTIKLSELKNIARKIAEKNLEVNGKYFCKIDGEKVQVVK